jgi:hypothetical protein
MQYKYVIKPVDSVKCPVVIETNGAVDYVAGKTCYEAHCYACCSDIGCCQYVNHPKITYFALFYPEYADVLGLEVDPFGLCTDGCEYYTDKFGCQCMLDFKRSSYREPTLTLTTYVNVIDVFS